MKKSLSQFILSTFEDENKKSLVAIVDGITNKSLTYQEAHDQSYSFAHSLHKFGLKKGDCVAIITPNHLNFFSAFIGIGLAGATSTSINPLYSEHEILHQVTATQAKLIISHSSCIEKVLKSSGSIPVMVLDDPTYESLVERIGSSAAGNLLHMKSFIHDSLNTFDKAAFMDPVGFDSNDTYTIPFSSGTTGKSKGVMLTHKNLIANILQMESAEGKHLRADPSKNRARGVTLCPLPFYHIFGLTVGLCMPLVTGQNYGTRFI
jgi:4-coumarate--CoA ligase